MSDYYMVPVSSVVTVKEHVGNLIYGKVKLTYDMANRLESVLGLPDVSCSNLESQFRSALLKSSEDRYVENLSSLRHVTYSEIKC